MRHEQNLGAIERVIRILGGGTAAIMGIALFIALT